MSFVKLDHPSEQDLQSFLRGELSRAEVCAVVRHLLAGCAACREVTGRLWSFGDFMEGIPR